MVCCTAALNPQVLCLCESAGGGGRSTDSFSIHNSSLTPAQLSQLGRGRYPKYMSSGLGRASERAERIMLDRNYGYSYPGHMR